MAKLLSNTRVYGTATVDTQLFVRGTNSAHSTTTGALQVGGGIGVAGGGFFTGAVTATNFVGAVSGTASLANDIANGTAGQLLYQIAPNDTGFAGPGIAGQILISAGTNAPTYVNTTTFVIGIAKNLLGGAADQFAYQTAAHTTNFISTGSMYVGRAVLADGILGNSINTSTNLAGGTAGQVPYQVSPGVTNFFGPGTAGQILVSAGTSAPVYTNTASIYVGNAVVSTHLRSGSAGQIPYQTGVSTTNFTGPGTAGQVLTSGGTGAPVYVNTGSLYVGRAVIADSASNTTSADGVKTVSRPNNAAHYLTFVDSNNSVATSESVYTTATVVVNPSTGNIGLGTTGPADRLELSGAAGTARIRLTNTTAGRSSILGLDASGFYWQPTNNGDLFQLRNAAGTSLLAFNAGSGFLGIGTTGPSERLHIDGGTGDARIRVSSADNSSYRGFEVRAGTAFKGGLFYRNTEGDVLQIWGPNESVRAIEINTTPNVKVVTGSSVHNTATGAMQVVGGLGVGGGGFFGGTVTATNFVGAFSGSISQINTVQSTTNAAHFVTFVDSNNTTAGAEAVYTNGNFVVNPGTGNVGIGTTGPFSKLQIGSNTFSGGNGMFANDRVGISNHGSLTGLMLASTYNDATYPEYGLVFVQGPNTSNYNVWSVSPDGPAKGSNLNFIYGANASNIHVGTPRVVIQGSTGNVGIGTTSPGAKLEIENGDLWLDAPGGGNPEIRFIDDSGISVAGAKIRYENNNGNLYIEHVWNQATSGIFFRNRTAGTALDTLTLMNGYVGIGNASPSYRLDVAAAANPFQTVARFGSGGSDILITHANATISHNASYNGGWTRTGSGYAGLMDFQGGQFLFQTSPTTAAGGSSIADFTTRFQITNAGNVGVGPNSPSFRLDITGTARATSDVRAPIFYDSDNTAYYLDPASTSIVNILISGTATPTGSTIGGIRSYGSTSAYMGASDAAGRTAFFGVDSSGYAMFGALTNHDTVLRANNTEYLRVHTAGYTTISGSTRSPIFYDSNDTAFYADPASTSRLNVVNFIGNHQFNGGYNTAHFYIKGTGLNNNAAPVITRNGTSILSGYGRGLMLVIINKSDLSTVSSATYDTYGNTTQSDSLATALDAMTNNQIGMLVSYDAIEAAVTTNLRNAARRKGLFKLAGTPSGSRRPYAAIFMGGGTSGVSRQVIESYEPNGGGNAMAVIATWVTTDGTQAAGFTGNSITNALVSGEPGTGDPAAIALANNGVQVTYSLGVGTEPSGTTGEIRATNEITAYYSDRRLKTNVSAIDNALEKLLTLNGITYTPNELAESFGYDKDKKLVGLFADEVEAVLPEAVRSAPFDTDKDGNSVSGENYKTIQYEKLVPLLIEAIKEQQKEINELKSRLN